MFSHKFDEIPNKGVIFHWYLLSFNAGCINAGGFLATGRFVSHVTGFATLFGVDLLSRPFGEAIGILSVPVFFLLGAFLAGLMIDVPLHNKRKPHFDYIMGLSAICLFLASNAGKPHFGAITEIIRLDQVYVLLALLCLACGLQNGAITSSSGKTIRTTHLSGLTTDLGLGLARLFILQDNPEKFSAETKTNWTRTGSIIAFILGSAAGAWFFIEVGYRGFVLNGLIASYAAWHGRRAKIFPHIIDPPQP